MLALVDGGPGLAPVPAGSRRQAFLKVVIFELLAEQNAIASLVLACRNEPSSPIWTGFIDVAHSSAASGAFANASSA